MSLVAEQELKRIKQILNLKTPYSRFWDSLTRVEKEAIFYVAGVPVRQYDDMTGRDWEQLTELHREKILAYVRKQSQLAELYGIGRG